MSRIKTQTMKVVILKPTPPPKPHDYSRLTLLAIALLVAIIILALFLPRAHADSAMHDVAYVAAAMMGEKVEVTVFPDASSMTATPATATPQPEVK